MRKLKLNFDKVIIILLIAIIFFSLIVFKKINQIEQEIQIQIPVEEFESGNSNSKNEMENSIQNYYFELTDEERYLVESIVTGEAGNQPYEGKVAVANCILNACIKDGIRPEEVQKNYQYGGWKSIEEFESECMAAYGNTILADEVREAVSQIFDDGIILSNEILWFYNPDYTYSSWHESQKFIFEIGNHRFFGYL